jgi:polysaccharide biosynthesis protein VpsQ
MRLQRWLPFCLFFLFVAGIIVGSDLGRLRSITGRMVKIGRLKILLGCTIVAVAMTVEECSQIWFPARTFDLIDLSANYLGITLAGLMWRNRSAV